MSVSGLLKRVFEYFNPPLPDVKLLRTEFEQFFREENGSLVLTDPEGAFSFIKAKITQDDRVLPLVISKAHVDIFLNDPDLFNRFSSIVLHVNTCNIIFSDVNIESLSKRMFDAAIDSNNVRYIRALVLFIDNNISGSSQANFAKIPQSEWERFKDHFEKTDREQLRNLVYNLSYDTEPDWPTGMPPAAFFYDHYSQEKPAQRL